MKALHRHVVVGLLLALGTHAQAMVLCASARGGLVAADACRKNHVQVDVGDLGLVGPSGPAGPAGPDGASVERPFRVVDANGRIACTSLARLGLRTQCVLEAGAESGPIQLVVYPDGTDASLNAVVFYAAAGCQGTPLGSEPSSLITRATLLGGSLFVAIGPQAVASVLSFERVDDECSNGVRTPHGTCCFPFAQAAQVVGAPTRRIDLSALGLAAPLRVEDR